MNLLLLNLSLHKNLAVINHMNKKNILKKALLITLQLVT